MDIEQIKQLAEWMREAELTEFEFEKEGLKLRIAREKQAPQAHPVFHTPTPAAALPAATPVSETASKQDEGLKLITSPMVGTFYRSASPESAAFVNEGSEIKPDSTVCIIEAMKVMNEIQAEMGGTIVEILVENEQTVEYGQPLFKVKPA